MKGGKLDIHYLQKKRRTHGIGVVEIDREIDKRTIKGNSRRWGAEKRACRAGMSVGTTR